MEMRNYRSVYGAAAAITAAAFFMACGSYSSPTSPGGSTGTATITLTATGVDPLITRVSVGQQVRFVNNDTQNHEVDSDPFPGHTDCPPINNVGLLMPGQSKTTGTFTSSKSCGFHDHLNHDAKNFQGQILVDTSQPAPGYQTTGADR